ncbi:MAG TPA: hypothetical protein VET88_11440 [Gammaproteobacteria bacterium]|nr:hypothetical protein [Gammaproteobacteria bacterium]
MLSTRSNLKAVIVTAHSPRLVGARGNALVKFVRAFRSIVKDHGYHGRRLVFIS